MEVSVVIPVYNAARYVAEAVRSALAQPETREVVLVEDASPDDSLAVCRRLAAENAKVRLLRHPDLGNHGAGASRNLGIRESRFEYIAFLDADDFMLPDRFRAARPLLESQPEIDGVYEAIGTVYETQSMRDFWTARGERELYTIAEGIPPEQLFEALVRGGKGEFSTDGVTVRTRIFERTGEFDPNLRLCQDTAMWIRMAAKGRLVAGSLTEPVSVRRLHEDNRVYKHRDRHMDHRTAMYRSLLAWGRAGNLERGRLFLLLECFMDHWYWHIPAARGWSPRRFRLQWLLFVIGIALRYPFAMRSTDYRHRLGQAFGLQRLTRWLSKPRLHRTDVSEESSPHRD